MQVANNFQYSTPKQIKGKTQKIGNNYNISNDISNNSVSFKAHFDNERIIKHGQNLLLRKETGFFRDMQTKNFVKDYIFEHFLDQPTIKMIIGGCSSGEEAFTYSMLLKNIKSRLSILGFDISEKSIEAANSGKMKMQKPDSFSKIYVDMYSSTHQDCFLSFDTSRKLRPEELEYKALFNEFFDVLPEKVKEKAPLSVRLQQWIIKMISLRK